MTKNSDDFETLFRQLERNETTPAVPESHEATILFASISHDKKPESIYEVLGMKDADELTWKNNCTDPIQKWEQLDVEPKTSSSDQSINQQLACWRKGIKLKIEGKSVEL